MADVRRQTILQVKIAFTSALVAWESLALAEQNLRTVDETERLPRLRVEKGEISELELLRIQVQRFTFERDAADARQVRAAAKIALRAAVGAAKVAEEFGIVGDLGFKRVQLGRDALVRSALANRPDLQAAEADYQLEADIRRALEH